MSEKIKCPRLTRNIWLAQQVNCWNKKPWVVSSNPTFLLLYFLISFGKVHNANIANFTRTLYVCISIQLLLEKVKSVRDLSHADNKAHIQRHPPRTDFTRVPKQGHLESHESNLCSPKLSIPWSAGHLASIYRKKWKTRR